MTLSETASLNLDRLNGLVLVVDMLIAVRRNNPDDETGRNAQADLLKEKAEKRNAMMMMLLFCSIGRKRSVRYLALARCRTENVGGKAPPEMC